MGINSVPFNELFESLKDILDQKTDFSDLKSAVQYLKTNGLLDKLPVTQFVTAMSKYIGNILNTPSENRYKCLKVENKVMQAYVLGIPGGATILTLIGFELSPDGAYYLFNNEWFDRLGENLKIIQETESMKWHIDRRVKSNALDFWPGI